MPESLGKPWKRGRSHRLPFVAFIFGSGVRSIRANSFAVPHQVDGEFTLSIVCLLCYQDMTARISSTILAVIFMENVRIWPLGIIEKYPLAANGKTDSCLRQMVKLTASCSKW